MAEKIYCIHWGLLGEWWHADAGVSEDEIAAAVHEKTMVSATVEQVKQRLFGGWPCDDGGSHIYHATGHYTYLGSNGDMEEGDRRGVWDNLINGNGDQAINREAPFAKDAPVQAAA